MEPTTNAIKTLATVTNAGFWSAHREIFINAGISVLILIAVWLLYRGIRHAINRFSRRRNLAQVDPGAETRFRMIGNLSAVVLFFVAVGLVFWVMDIQALRRVAVGMFASAGVAGIAIGFAAQTTISNLVSGIIIAFVQPIRLGDNVTIEGEYGTVENIGLFYTLIRTWDNRRLVLPNKLLSDRAIRNYTLIDPHMPALVVIRLEYGADLDRARALLLEEARAHPAFLVQPPPSVEVIDADNERVSLRLMAWAADQDHAARLAGEVREKVLKRIAEEKAAGQADAAGQATAAAAPTAGPAGRAADGPVESGDRPAEDRQPGE
jgi:small conductance mechanosensitive channel